ncbi:MAG: hypothetical protein ABL869_07215 [Candidatus Nitrotoga sp.]
MVRYIAGMICSLFLMNSCFADNQLSAGVSLKQFLQMACLKLLSIWPAVDGVEAADAIR